MKSSKDYPAAVRLFEATKNEGTTASRGSWEDQEEWKKEMYIRLAHATIQSPAQPDAQGSSQEVGAVPEWALNAARDLFPSHAEREANDRTYAGSIQRYAAIIARHARPAHPAPAGDREGKLRDTIEEMDRIHDDIMTNGPRCTCGEGDEWCARCAKSSKLSRLAAAALATQPTPKPCAPAELSPIVRKTVECLARELRANVGDEAIQAMFISTPATCQKCGQRVHATTTGKMLNSCPVCNGVLKPCAEPSATPSGAAGEARLLAVAKGCSDYGGGHRGECYDAFQHGIATVVRALEAAMKNDPNDTQVNALHRIGAAQQKPDANAIEGEHGPGI